MSGHSHRKAHHHTLAFEARLRIFCTLTALAVLGLAAAVLALLHFSVGPLLTVLGLLLLILLIVFTTFIEAAIRPVQTLANVVAALREEDYSFRARGASREDALGGNPVDRVGGTAGFFCGAGGVGFADGVGAGAHRS